MARVFYVVLFIVCSLAPLSAQDLDPRLTPVLKELKTFNYELVINRSTELLSGAAGLTRTDSLELYRMIGISNFSLLNMPEALHAFGLLLELDPDYKLNVLDTPPKIINYFSEVKKLYFGNTPQPLTIVQYDTVYQRSFTRDRQLAYSLLFPGLGHLYGDMDSKGWALVSAGTLSLAAAIYFSIDSADKEDDYLKETDPARIEHLYKEYNNSYHMRNISYVIFGAIWVYAQVDLLFLEEFRITNNLSIRYNPAAKSSLIFSYSF
jgi:hypothetical protein